MCKSVCSAIGSQLRSASRSTFECWLQAIHVCFGLGAVIRCDPQSRPLRVVCVKLCALSLDFDIEPDHHLITVAHERTNGIVENEF